MNARSNSIPRIYWILDFTIDYEAPSAQQVTHQVHLVAATSQQEAIKQAQHEGISLHGQCFISTDESAERGGSSVRNITEMRTDAIGQDQFQRWVRMMTNPDRIDGETTPAPYTQLR